MQEPHTRPDPLHASACWQHEALPGLDDGALREPLAVHDVHFSFENQHVLVEGRPLRSLLCGCGDCGHASAARGVLAGDAADVFCDRQVRRHDDIHRIHEANSHWSVAAANERSHARVGRAWPPFAEVPTLAYACAACRIWQPGLFGGIAFLSPPMRTRRAFALTLAATCIPTLAGAAPLHGRAQALTPGCDADAPRSPAEWLERWRRLHIGTAEYLPAREPSNDTAPRIPRQIMQMARNTSAAQSEHGDWIRSWTRLNPQHEYLMLDDDTCADFVDRFCSDRERLAYAQLLTGAARSDLFRLVFLRELGGYYADHDVELTKPLQLLSPHDASMVAASNFEPDFMGYEPKHPFVDAALAYSMNRIESEVRKLRDGVSPRCSGSHECVIRVTGPVMYWSALAEAAPGWGCTTNRAGGERPSQHTCANSHLEPLRRLHVCAPGVEKHTYCGGVHHWDCRNSPQRRDCGSGHYSSARVFFNASVLLAPARQARPPCPR